MEVLRLLATSWPAATVLIAVSLGTLFLLLFRGSIATAIPKIRRVGRSGVELDVPTPPSQAEESTARLTESDAFVAAEQLKKALDSPLLIEQETRIKRDLAERGLDVSPASVDVLVRYLAAFQLAYAFEALYSLIYGSQLTLLQTLNSQAQGMEYQIARTFSYDIAAVIYPDVYRAYSFDEYIHFLLTTGLVSRADDRIFITPMGREFLAYLIRQGKSLTRQY